MTDAPAPGAAANHETDKDTFPRQYARTQRLTLGEPRNIEVSPDGRRVVFVRSRSGDDATNCLWVMDLPQGIERVVADPVVLLDHADDADLPPQERARRERAREGAAGVVGFATNAAVNVAAFALSGRLFVCGLLSGGVRELVVDGPVFDPRPDPTARRVAYVRGGDLRIAELDATSRTLAGEDDPDVTWGSAEFIAAEEMQRSRGYWWSPDGESIAATRVDTSPVQRWFISEPAVPSEPAQSVAYPAAGTANAVVTLHVLGLDGRRIDVEWDNNSFPYLTNVRWVGSDRLLVSVQSRDQRELVVLDADARTGQTRPRWRDTDPAWVEIAAGVPGELNDGRLVTIADRDGCRRLLVDGEPVTPDHLQVRSVSRIGDESVTFAANPLDDPTVVHVWQWRAGDASTTRLRSITDAAGVHSASVGGAHDDVLVIRRSSLDALRTTTRIVTLDVDRPSPAVSGATITNVAETPLVQPNVRLLRLGARRLAAALLLPHGTTPDDRLPVLLDPYGGPHAQRVLASTQMMATSQWFADQGFAVLVVDGRGTPGRGSAWERTVHRDLATAVLDDQVDALHAAAEQFPQLDLARVAIRGWSFGGYLAALAVLRRPDIFHAAIAGAPVTEWRLYDTHYTERYLGDPTADAAPYDATSLIRDAHLLERPLLLIHGLADDNVVAAHTLQLSSALLAAGREHEVLPLSGVTHMTPQPVVAENLLLHQLAFLRRSLALRP